MDAPSRRRGFPGGARLAAAWWIGVLLAGAVPPSHAADDEAEAILTDSGAPLKVIVRHDSALYASPDRAARNQPVRQFEFYYVLPAQPGTKEKTRNGFYRAATTAEAGGEVGWLPEGDVVEWSHRQALAFRPGSGRERAQFYAKPDDMRQAYAARNAATPAPISREPEHLAYFALLPILSQLSFEHQGDRTAYYEVAYLHARNPRGESSKGGGGGVSMERLEKELTLDLAFVIDTTGSMEPWIEGVKEVVRRVSRSITAVPKLKGNVRLALVIYRDKDDAYVARIACPLEDGANLDTFLSRLGEVKADGGGDTPEQVLVGLRKAIEELKWNPVSYRHIVLIGDASSKVGAESIGNLTVETILTMAQPEAVNRETVVPKITIHALQPDSDDAADKERCRVQFQKLAQGREHPGLYERYNRGDVDTFVGKLVDLITTASSYVEMGRSGKKDELLAARDKPWIGPLLELVESAGTSEGPLPEGFARGYVAEVDMRGNQMLEPYVLVTRGQLETFQAALEFCIKAMDDAGDPGSKDVRRIVASLQILATHVNLGETLDANMPLAKLLSLMLGFPVRNKIFEMSPARLANMTESDYRSWVNQVRTSQAVLRGYLNKPEIWFYLGRESRPAHQHCFVRVTDLP